MTSGLPGIRKPYCCAYRFSKSATIAASAGRRANFERRVGSLVLDVQRALAGDARVRDALRLDFGARGGFERSEIRSGRRQRGLRQHGLDGLLAQRPHIRQSHSIGGQHARERVNENARHAQCIGHQTRMLATGAAKAAQRVLGDVVAALHGDMLDRVGHVLDGDAQETVGHILGVRAARATPASPWQVPRICVLTTSASSASSPPAPNTLGNSSGSSLPTITLQSVTVSGPPRR